MEIEKGKTPNNCPCIKFKDYYDVDCKIVAQDPLLRFTIKSGDTVLASEFAIFDQEQIKQLLPYLQSFAETGTLEPQESPLQGGDIAEAIDAIKDELTIDQSKRIEALVQTSARLNYKNYHAEKHIKAIEELLRKWRGFGLVNDISESTLWADLDKHTAQLLGEEEPNEHS